MPKRIELWYPIKISVRAQDQSGKGGAKPRADTESYVMRYLPTTVIGTGNQRTRDPRSGHLIGPECHTEHGGQAVKPEMEQIDNTDAGVASQAHQQHGGTRSEISKCDYAAIWN